MLLKCIIFVFDQWHNTLSISLFMLLQFVIFVFDPWHNTLSNSPFMLLQSIMFVSDPLQLTLLIKTGCRSIEMLFCKKYIIIFLDLIYILCQFVYNFQCDSKTTENILDVKGHICLSKNKLNSVLPLLKINTRHYNIQLR